MEIVAHCKDCNLDLTKVSFNNHGSVGHLLVYKKRDLNTVLTKFKNDLSTITKNEHKLNKIIIDEQTQSIEKQIKTIQQHTCQKCKSGILCELFCHDCNTFICDGVCLEDHRKHHMMYLSIFISQKKEFMEYVEKKIKRCTCELSNIITAVHELNSLQKTINEAKKMVDDNNEIPTCDTDNIRTFIQTRMDTKKPLLLPNPTKKRFFVPKEDTEQPVKKKKIRGIFKDTPFYLNVGGTKKFFNLFPFLKHIFEPYHKKTNVSDDDIKSIASKINSLDIKTAPESPQIGDLVLQNDVVIKSLGNVSKEIIDFITTKAEIPDQYKYDTPQKIQKVRTKLNKTLSFNKSN